MPHYTSGQTYFYPAFNASKSEDALKFAHEFGTVLAMPIMLEAVMRVRATKGTEAELFNLATERLKNFRSPHVIIPRKFLRQIY